MNTFDEKEFCIESELDVARVVLEAGRFAETVGFNSSQQVKISTIVSELGRNILYHAIKGYITFQLIKNNGVNGVEIRAQDDGPGIENIENALKEHFSTRKTLGLGLGAVKRMSDEMTIESQVGKGTVIIARKWLKNVKP